MSLLRLNTKFLLAFLGVVAIMIASYQWDDSQTTAVAARTVREAAPLILAALCGLIGERSGIINIGIGIGTCIKPCKATC